MLEDSALSGFDLTPEQSPESFVNKGQLQLGTTGIPAVMGKGVVLIDTAERVCFIPTGVVPRKLKLSSLAEMPADEGFYLWGIA